MRISLSLLLILSAQVLVHGQSSFDQKKIPWSLTVVVLDNIDSTQKAEIPVSEAVAFIEARSRFVIDVQYVTSSMRHGYTPYKTGPINPRTRQGRNTVYAMMGWDVPPALIRSLPVSSSYLFLYKLFNKKPVQAGSSLGIDYGLVKGGIPRPYATVPTDQWYYTNTPKHGFDSWAAQILTHEIINTIQAKIEASPYRCPTLKGTPGSPAVAHETERLSKLTDACYRKLLDHPN